MKKSTLLTIAALILALAMGVSGTLAYLTDTDSDVNVMVLGSIKIDQHEQDRNGNDFDQYQTLLPIVGDTSKKDNNGYPANGNYIDKIVTVENTGKNDAYVRTFIAVPVYAYEGQDVNNASANVIHWNGYSKGDETGYPAAGKVPGKEGTVANNWSWGKDASVQVWPGNYGDWNSFNAVIDGMNYEVFVVTNTEAVKPGEITAPNMIGIYLDSKVDYDHDAGKYTYDGKEISNFDGTVKVLVATQAVQFDSGWKDAFNALDTAFGAPAADNHPWIGAKAEPTTALVSSESELIAALNADVTDIKLGDSFAIESSIPVNNDMTIEMNGHDLDIKAPFEVANGSSLTVNAGESDVKLGKDGLANLTEGELVVNGGNFSNANDGGALLAVDGNKEMNVTLNNVNYKGTSDSSSVLFTTGDNLTVTVNGGEFEAGRGFLLGDGSSVNGATITATKDANMNPAVYAAGDVTIDDCDIKAANNALAVAGGSTLTVNDSNVVAGEGDLAFQVFSSGGTINVNNCTWSGKYGTTGKVSSPAIINIDGVQKYIKNPK